MRDADVIKKQAVDASHNGISGHLSLMALMVEVAVDIRDELHDLEVRTEGIHLELHYIRGQMNETTSRLDRFRRG